MSSDNHLRDLRRLYDTTEPHIQNLKSLGVEATLYGAMLSSVLLTNLPPDLRLIVSRKVSSDDEITIENLLKLFEEELVARKVLLKSRKILLMICVVVKITPNTIHCNLCSEQALTISKTSLERATIMLFIGTKLKKRGASTSRKRWFQWSCPL